MSYPETFRCQGFSKPETPWFRLDLFAYLRRRQRAHLLIASALDSQDCRHRDSGPHPSQTLKGDSE